MPFLVNGVYAAIATPLDSRGNCDNAALVAHGLQLLETGCHGLALLGTTGEANSFSVGERTAILEAVVDGGIEASKIMLGSGAAAISDAIALTRHGIAAGVTDFLVLPPFYYKNVTEAGVVAYFSALIEDVASPKLRVVLYHIPQFSGVRITSSVIDDLRRKFPDTIVGIKDSSGDIEQSRHFVREHSDLALLTGADTMMLPLLAAGGAGCITGLANIVSSDLRLIYDDYADQTASMRVAVAQLRLEALRSLTSRLPSVSGMKGIIAEHLCKPAWRRMRPPLREIGHADQARTRETLAEVFAIQKA